MHPIGVGGTMLITRAY